jgi:hypothetical protein
MQATDMFTSVIDAHLQSVAQADPLFATTLKKPNKNLKDCVTYILNEVKKSGRNGFADEEIFGMAVHYYDEDDIQPGAPVKATVVVNHSIKGEKKQSPTQVVAEQKKAAKKVAAVDRDLVNQISLF